MKREVNESKAFFLEVCKLGLSRVKLMKNPITKFLLKISDGNDSMQLCN